MDRLVNVEVAQLEEMKSYGLDASTYIIFRIHIHQPNRITGLSINNIICWQVLLYKVTKERWLTRVQQRYSHTYFYSFFFLFFFLFGKMVKGCCRKWSEKSKRG